MRKEDELGINDGLVEPYSENYARTRFRAWLMRTACRWIRPPVAESEEARLEALHRLAILDTPREERFDRLTQLAAAHPRRADRRDHARRSRPAMVQVDLWPRLEGDAARRILLRSRHL